MRRAAPWLACGALAVALAAVPAGPARPAEPLVADLSNHLIAITTGFTGTDVLLFGATDGEGDIAVVVRGEDRREVVRRKQRVGGIWLHGRSYTFTAVPSFYGVATSKPLAEIAPAAVLARHQIGAENLKFDPERREGDPEHKEFAEALLRLKQEAQLFPTKAEKVQFLGNQLFRVRLAFPANVPTGNYRVEVFLLRRGEVVSAQLAPLVISKIGLGADISEFARRSAPAYGTIAILMALMAGSAAAFAFRKV